MYLDSDDWLNSSDLLTEMYKKAEETDADYVEVGMQRVMDRHKWIKKTGHSPVFGLIQQPELFEKYYLSFFGVNILAINIWGKLYRKSVLETAHIQPMGISMGEDLAFNIQLFPHLNRIYILNKTGYNYRFGGMTTKYNPYLLHDLKKLYCLKEKLIDKYQYHKAINYICIELKNVLKSDICQMITFKINTPNEIKKKISQELQSPEYQRIVQTCLLPSFQQDPFVKAIKNQDTDTLYQICQEKTKKERFNRIAKKVASFILTHI